MVGPFGEHEPPLCLASPDQPLDVPFDFEGTFYRAREIDRSSIEAFGRVLAVLDRG